MNLRHVLEEERGTVSTRSKPFDATHIEETHGNSWHDTRQKLKKCFFCLLASPKQRNFFCHCMFLQSFSMEKSVHGPSFCLLGPNLMVSSNLVSQSCGMQLAALGEGSAPQHHSIKFDISTSSCGRSARACGYFGSGRTTRHRHINFGQENHVCPKFRPTFQMYNHILHSSPESRHTSSKPKYG